MLHLLIFLHFHNVGLGTCFNDLPLSELPADIREDITKILMKTLDTVHECESPDTEEVQFLLYTKPNVQTSTDLNLTQDLKIESKEQTVLIIHGWLSDANSSSFPKIRDAYLTKHDYNVIIVDWSKTAGTFYTHAFCALPVIAKKVGEFLCLLDSKYKISLDTIHLVGHSLGGQMSGLIGQNTMEMCNKKVDRITALDPAGPLFLGLAADRRLDSSDANYVQVIHTNGGVFGYLTGCGQTDFYVNCGIHQKGCITIDLSDASKLVDSLLSDITCSHSRSQEYMAESIYKDNFIGKSCTGCPLGCLADPTLGTYANMGQDSRKDSNGSFLVTTEEKSPYAQD